MIDRPVGTIASDSAGVRMANAGLGPGSAAAAVAAIGQKRKRAAGDIGEHQLVRSLPPELRADFSGTPCLEWGNTLIRCLQEWTSNTPAPGPKRAFTVDEWPAIDGFIPNLMGYLPSGCIWTRAMLASLFNAVAHLHKHPQRVGVSHATPEILASALHLARADSLYATDVWAWFPPLVILAPELAWRSRLVIVSAEPLAFQNFDPLFIWISAMEQQHANSHLLTLTRCWKHMELIGCLADQRWSDRQLRVMPDAKWKAHLISSFIARVMTAIYDLGVACIGKELWTIVIDLLLAI